MLRKDNTSNSYFWLLLITSVLIGLGLAMIGWGYQQGWLQSIWHICQSGFQRLTQHLTVTWQLLLLVIVGVVIIRGVWSIGQQIWRTRRFTRLFLPLRETPPARLLALLDTHRLTANDMVYLNLTNTHAFCLCFWQPQIWLTSGLVNLLTDEELDAVLAHEVYHCRRRDPLRLLISRALQSAFFFLPMVTHLAQSAELQQEMAADRSAIAYLQDDLPLLCALQKLLSRAHQEPLLPKATFAPFNITEARLRSLIDPTGVAPSSWRAMVSGWAINLGVMLLLGGIGFLATQPIIEHGEMNACIIKEEISWLVTR